MATLALFFSFLPSGIGFLRERCQGTMERLMTSPISRLDIVAGYLLGSFVFALVQTFIIVLRNIYVLGMHYPGDRWHMFVFPGGHCRRGEPGYFSSRPSRVTSPRWSLHSLIIVPQLFVSGVLGPFERMPTSLQWLAHILPLTYAIRGTRSC